MCLFTRKWLFKFGMHSKHLFLSDKCQTQQYMKQKRQRIRILRSRGRNKGRCAQMLKKLGITTEKEVRSGIGTHVQFDFFLEFI